MNKFLIIGLLLFPLMGNAANLPCSGNKGGINHCEGSKFVCNDGSTSSSTKDCAVVFGGNTAVPSVTAPAIKPSANIAPPVPVATSSQIMKLDYEGFTVWLDCEKRGAVKFQYNAQHDTGSFPRVEKFALDPNVPAQCQQFTANAYGNKYDRGHLVPANHLDYSAEAIKATNNMTNILPQAANMNRGAWLQTEEIIECYRDIDELLVIGGVIWGNNPADDYFVQSHGVKTPDAFWKVIVRGTGQSEQAIAKLTGEKIPVAQYAKDTKPSSSWVVPKGCNKS